MPDKHLVSPAPVLLAPSGDASLSKWLNYLEQLHPKAIELGLERVRAVANKLNIESKAVKYVVAGTNGKGSTCAMLEAMLSASGYRVGMYTSPHLIDFNERARVNGEPVTDAELITAFVEVEKARGDISLTYFEFTTLAILSLFAKQTLEAWVLEVGLGGRLDAVNLVNADCAVLTSIDLDHTEWLGDTREKIGWEKAHVFRADKPAICADPAPPSSVTDHAAEIGADIWLFGRDFNYSGDRQQWAFAGRKGRRNALAYPALRGANQLLNAAGALAAIESTRHLLPVTQQGVRQGLLQAALPGRFQILPGQPIIILDVAHNPHAAAVLEKNLGNMGFHPFTYAVFGMMGDKAVDEVIRNLAPRFDRWFCSSLPSPRALSGTDLKARVEDVLSTAKIDIDPAPTADAFETPAAAFEAASQLAKPDDRIIVFGSFMTVAGVLAKVKRR